LNEGRWADDPNAATGPPIIDQQGNVVVAPPSQTKPKPAYRQAIDKVLAEVFSDDQEDDQHVIH
jgi:hypothetical protein